MYDAFNLQVQLMHRQIAHDQDRAKTNLQIVCERYGFDFNDAIAQVNKDASETCRGWANSCRLICARLERNGQDGLHNR